MKADLAFCGCMILWAVGFIGAELGVTPSDIKELVPTMTPTTITILAVAAYFAVGYVASIWAYVKYDAPNGGMLRPDHPPISILFLFFWVFIIAAWLFVRPHRYFAALVKKLNTPAPVQVSGAFAGGGNTQRWQYRPDGAPPIKIDNCDIKPSGVQMNIGPGILGTGILREKLEADEADPMARFTHAGRVWEPVSIKSSFPGESFMSCRAVDDD
jgi:hypothetical protein